MLRRIKGNIASSEDVKKVEERRKDEAKKPSKNDVGVEPEYKSRRETNMGIWTSRNNDWCDHHQVEPDETCPECKKVLDRIYKSPKQPQEQSLVTHGGYNAQGGNPKNDVADSSKGDKNDMRTGVRDSTRVGIEKVDIWARK